MWICVCLWANPEIDALFELYDKPDVPGASVGVYQRGEIVFQKGYGQRHLEANAAATSHTNYRLASLTKQFTAMAVMILKQDGQLDFEDKLIDRISGFPAYGSLIRIRHLLHHQSGLRDYEDHIPSSQTEQLSDRDVVGILKQQNSTYFNPGSQYRYSNSGYAVLAEIVARVSGQTFESFLRERIFIPLGMYATVAHKKGVNSVLFRAFGYTPRAGSFNFTDQSLTSAVLGDGGVYSSVSELFLWDQSLYSETLVSQTLLNMAFTPGLLNNGTPTSYGFGWVVESQDGYKRLSHTGSTIGQRSAIVRFPERELTVVVLINREGAMPWKHASRIASFYLPKSK